MLKAKRIEKAKKDKKKENKEIQNQSKAPTLLQNRDFFSAHTSSQLILKDISPEHT